MKYPIPTINTPIDPILIPWEKELPEKIRKKTSLMNFLMRVCHRIYDNNGISRESEINPFYKIVELLDADRLEYGHLQKIKEYYHFDIIRYLTCGNRAEHYIGYPCYSAKDLRSALAERKNLTDENTLANILSCII